MTKSVISTVALLLNLSLSIPTFGGGGIGTGNPDSKLVCNPHIDKECKLSSDQFEKMTGNSKSAIQIFNLTADQGSKLSASTGSGQKTDLRRRERIKQELANEAKLIEKIEADRLQQEATQQPVKTEGKYEYTSRCTPHRMMAFGCVTPIDLAASPTKNVLP